MKKRERTFIHVITNRKTAHIHWCDDTLSSWDELKTRTILKAGGYRVMLHDLFCKYRDQVSYKSCLSNGGYCGCWTYCPLEAVPELLEILYSQLCSWSYMTKLRTIIDPNEKKVLMRRIEKHNRMEGKR